MSGCCFPSAAAVLSFCATLLKAYFVCFDLSISVRDLFRVTGEGRKDAEWIGTAPNSWSVLTNARGSHSARGQRDRKWNESFDCWEQPASVPDTLPLFSQLLSLSCERCWQDLRDERSGQCVCLANFDNINPTRAVNLSAVVHQTFTWR